jgi:hypothetical protein
VVSAGNRFLAIGAAAGSLALLAAVVLMLWPPDPTDYTFTAGREQADGETVGWVSKVEANTIHVNSGPFGDGVVPLVVTKATKITVGAKEGWFEDIRPGGQVKVAYELYHGRRFARSVELLVDEGARRAARPAAPLRGASGPAAPAERGPATVTSPSPPAAEARPAPAPRVAESSGVTPAPTPRPATTTAKPAAPAAAAPSAPQPEIRPAPRPEPAPVRPQPTEIVPPPQRASTTAPARNVSAPDSGARPPEPTRAVDSPRPPAPAAPRPVEPARGTEGAETTDGSAAVDWLLRSRR